MDVIKDLEQEEAARVMGDKKIPVFEPGDTVRCEREDQGGRARARPGL